HLLFNVMIEPPPTSTLFPYTTLFRSIRELRKTQTPQYRTLNITDNFKDIRYHLNIPATLIISMSSKNSLHESMTRNQQPYFKNAKRPATRVMRIASNKEERIIN